MQLKVFIDLDSPLILPINYNHILQGIIYTAANNSNGKFTKELHDEGIPSDGNDQFKLFCFSKIIGNYSITDKHICFHKSIFFEVRSIDPYFIHLVYESFSKYGIRFQNRCFKPRLKLENKIITDSHIYVQMLSPIVAIGKTDDNKTQYLSPRDFEFCSYLCNNFFKKYQTYYHNLPNNDLEIVVGDVSFRDKCVTKFKGILVNAWNCRLYIQGSPEYLTFIYNVGLGSKNSQGFGMINIIEEQKL